MTKLSFGSKLEDRDIERLQQLCESVVEIEGGADLIQEGDRPHNVHVVIAGLACRYKMLPDGRRSIFALLVPGDFCDLHVALLDEMDHCIAVLGNSTVVRIPRGAILRLIDEHPRINRALWWATLVDEATLREWVVNAGRRPAEERMAHLFSEMLVRMRAVNLAPQNSFPFPLTQMVLADALGLSAVHVNRSLQTLRRLGLVAFKSGVLTVRDEPGLQAFCGFDPNYLHFRSRKPEQARPRPAGPVV